MRSASVADARGTVTAEFAAVVPALILVLAACLGCLRLGTAQLLLGDAAAVAARSEARDPGSAVRVAGMLAPGAAVSVSTRGEFRCVSLTAQPLDRPPLDTITLSASQCAPADAR